jgi:hypothetical protein
MGGYKGRLVAMQGDGWLCKEDGCYIGRWLTMREIGGYAGRWVAI